MTFIQPTLVICNYFAVVNIFSWTKAPALYVTMSQEEVVEVGHFLDLAFRAKIELRNVKVKITFG